MRSSDIIRRKCKAGDRCIEAASGNKSSGRVPLLAPRPDPLMHALHGLLQLIRERFLLIGDLCGKHRSDPFVKHQQLADGRCLKIALRHDGTPSLIGTWRDVLTTIGLPSG